MMGDKKPGDYKKVILAAFADKVAELKSWLDKEIANVGDSAGPKTLEKLALLRKTLREAQRNREKAMMGNKKLSTIKEEIREAFAKEGLDVERWLDMNMAKLNKSSPADPSALKTLQMVRNALRKAVKDKEKGRARKTKKPPAA